MAMNAHTLDPSRMPSMQACGPMLDPAGKEDHVNAPVSPDIDLLPCCRHCGTGLSVLLADLGLSPVANDYVPAARAGLGEMFHPLQVRVCPRCRLAQTRDLLAADAIFRDDYAYFSSCSDSWLEHARRYVGDMVTRFALPPGAQHVEIASNDGYLLQYAQAVGLRCLGVEPCASVAHVALDKGIDTRIAFFGRALASQLRGEGWQVDLLTANNVLAHVPDLNDFLAGVTLLLAPTGVATFEVQHLLRLMQGQQFDTIYHEHFSYFSLIAAQHVFAAAGLEIFDVELLPTHGGSIRFFACHPGAHPRSPRVDAVLQEELAYGLHEDAVYVQWSEQVRGSKRALLQLLCRLKADGMRIAAYGAPAKAATLLNYCGIGRDFIDFTVDRAASKQGRLVPGVRIPILAPEAIAQQRPDYLLVLVWNLREEVMQQMAGIRAWGGRFILPLPQAIVED